MVEQNKKEERKKKIAWVFFPIFSLLLASPIFLATIVDIVELRAVRKNHLVQHCELSVALKIAFHPHFSHICWSIPISICSPCHLHVAAIPLWANKTGGGVGEHTDCPVSIVSYFFLFQHLNSIHFNLIFFTPDSQQEFCHDGSGRNTGPALADPTPYV